MGRRLTAVVVAALFGLGAAPAGADTLETDEQLAPFIAEAADLLLAAGYDIADLVWVEVEVADLEGGVLGEAVGRRVSIDRDAGGRGWFVDPTPRDAEEFGPARAGIARARVPGPADGRIDLLSTVIHELGHTIGLRHGDAPFMAGRLAAGTRALPPRVVPGVVAIA